jgi:hypothetical protein
MLPMAEHVVYLVWYAEEMTANDRATLTRRGFEFYGDGFSVTPGTLIGEQPGATVYQAVRVTARSVEDARQQVIDALGREPDGLHATLAMPLS